MKRGALTAYVVATLVKFVISDAPTTAVDYSPEPPSTWTAEPPPPPPPPPPVPEKTTGGRRAEDVGRTAGERTCGIPPPWTMAVLSAVFARHSSDPAKKYSVAALVDSLTAPCPDRPRPTDAAAAAAAPAPAVVRDFVRAIAERYLYGLLSSRLAPEPSSSSAPPTPETAAADSPAAVPSDQLADDTGAVESRDAEPMGDTTPPRVPPAGTVEIRDAGGVDPTSGRSRPAPLHAKRLMSLFVPSFAEPPVLYRPIAHFPKPFSYDDETAETSEQYYVGSLY